ALGVVEVGGYGDDGIGDGVAQIRLGVPLQLHEDAGRDLLRGVILAVDVDGPVGAHVTLHRADRVIGVGDRLTLGDLTDEDLPVLERDDGGCRATALRVGDDDGVASFENGDDAVRRPQVDSYGFGHDLDSSRCRSLVNSNSTT